VDETIILPEVATNALGYLAKNPERNRGLVNTLNGDARVIAEFILTRNFKSNNQLSDVAQRICAVADKRARECRPFA
jgi:hypothetical protein